MNTINKFNLCKEISIVLSVVQGSKCEQMFEDLASKEAIDCVNKENRLRLIQTKRE